MYRHFYMRELPPPAVAFTSPAGKSLFQDALREGGMDGYFRLAQAFTTQAEPAFCGISSLVMVLNALGIDPGVVWKGPWRFYTESMLECCTPLEVVKQKGVSFDTWTCLARCHGCDVAGTRATQSDVDTFREVVRRVTRQDESFLVVTYSRSVLNQTGDGHFSPVAGYHAASDRVLIMDVARFKYPAHWVPLPDLFQAMLPHDPDTGRSRGYLLVTRAQKPPLSRAVFAVASNFGALVRDVAQHLSRCIPAASSAAAAGDAAADARPSCRDLIEATDHPEAGSEHRVLESGELVLSDQTVVAGCRFARRAAYAVATCEPALPALQRALQVLSTADATAVASGHTCVLRLAGGSCSGAAAGGASCGTARPVPAGIANLTGAELGINSDPGAPADVASRAVCSGFDVAREAPRAQAGHAGAAVGATTAPTEHAPHAHDPAAACMTTSRPADVAGRVCELRRSMETMGALFHAIREGVEEGLAVSNWRQRAAALGRSGAEDLFGEAHLTALLLLALPEGCVRHMSGRLHLDNYCGETHHAHAHAHAPHAGPDAPPDAPPNQCASEVRAFLLLREQAVNPKRVLQDEVEELRAVATQMCSESHLVPSEASAGAAAASPDGPDAPVPVQRAPCGRAGSCSSGDAPQHGAGHSSGCSGGGSGGGVSAGCAGRESRS